MAGRSKRRSSRWTLHRKRTKLGMSCIANGQDIPFVFLFLTSTGYAAEGAKTRMLRDLLKYMSERCAFIFTLSDNEPAEINACRAKILRAKHQLCYWHGITYIKERLAENKPPAAYDPRKAHKIFAFIDPTWAPGITAVYAGDDEDGEGESEELATQITISFPFDFHQKRLTHLPSRNHFKHTGDTCVPVWPNPPKVRATARSEFCPKDFRGEIIEMYRMHLHQHPRIHRNDPEEPYIWADDIHRRAAQDMYNFCYSNELSQVWVYLWNRCLLPRVKCTLDYARGFRRIGRPQVLAGCQVDAKAEWVDKSRSDEHRRVAKELQVLKSAPGTKGRAERLEHLADDETREPGTYATDIQKWVCPWINRFLMCKHLIREANKLLDNRPLTKLRFFLDLRWNHFPPYYSIPGIHAATEPDDADKAVPKVPIFLGIRRADGETREQEERQASLPQKTADTPPWPDMTLAGGNKGDPEGQLVKVETLQLHASQCVRLQDTNPSHIRRVSVTFRMNQ
ncbi:hypothetical protein FB451DRAFT_1494892 [Mycena latifolia]|nr:hypothetical protein FB451DRAFT_1494892 [Mycena latifolia]